ncbi:MAG: metalloprotease TldD [Dehalococcoidia bacterium]|nr:metalloprotease TldD [Dehalococcoidia bacterium]
MSARAQRASDRFFAEQHDLGAPELGRLLDLALERGGDYADVFAEHSLSRNISFEEQAIKSASASTGQGVGVRVVNGDAIGYAYSEDFAWSSLQRAAQTAANIAQTRGRREPIAVATATLPDYYPVDDPAVKEPAEAKLELIRRADAAARAYSQTITHAMVMFAEEERRTLVATSEGILASDLQPRVTLALQVVSERNGDRQSAFQGSAAREGLDYFAGDYSPEETAREAARMATTLHDAVDAPAGAMPVVLGHGWSGVLLHEAVGHGLEADFNRKRTSLYTDRLGEKVAASGVTVIDDATLPGYIGSLNMDDEGSPGQRTVLIEDGVLVGYMHDWISARHFDTAQTGNGRREDYHHYPVPRMTNTYLLGGEADPDEIIRSVDKGVYCVNYSGGQVNISNGDFVFSTVEAYLIEGGKRTAPLKHTSLIGNGPALLRNVTMIGSDPDIPKRTGTCGKEGQGVPVGAGVPTLLVSELNIGGTQQ